MVKLTAARKRTSCLETYRPLTPRVPVPPGGPRPMTREDIANVELVAQAPVRYTLAAKGGAA